MAQQRSHVPKFGNWESEENVPYTAYFDKARKGRTGGKMINPNDPEENSDIVTDNADLARTPASRIKAEQEDPVGQGAVRRAHERPRSREDGDLKQFVDSPARNDNMNRRTSGESVQQRYSGRGVSSGENYKRSVRPSVGSENSFERSPLHPQARVSGRGSGAPSPAWEGKGSYEGSHGTPGRSRLKPSIKGDESPDKGAAVPKFGDWDENNPAAADGYTHIFNKVREERNSGGRVPGMSNESPHSTVRRPPPTDSVKGCCFPWSRK